MDDKLQEYINWCCDKFLSYRPRTVYEMQTYIRRKLIKKQIADPDGQQRIIQKKVAELVEADIVNDETFTRWYISEKNYFKPRGKIRLKHELAQKGVDSSIVDTILAESKVTDQDLLKQLLTTKFYSTDFSDKTTYDKALQRLQRLGFRYSDIKTAIEEYVEKE